MENNHTNDHQRPQEVQHRQEIQYHLILLQGVDLFLAEVQGLGPIDSTVMRLVLNVLTQVINSGMSQNLTCPQHGMTVLGFEHNGHYHVNYHGSVYHYHMIFFRAQIESNQQEQSHDHQGPQEDKSESADGNQPSCP